MRRFSSYGPVDTDLHYYAPREALIEKAYKQLTSETPGKSGHYITVWAPRQCGKTWVMQKTIRKIKQSNQYTSGIFTMELGKKVKSKKSILELFTTKLNEVFQVKFPIITEFKQIPALFTRSYFNSPVILVIDEFDSLNEEFISDFATVFRDMFVSRSNEDKKNSREKTYLLHGLALVGVRSVLGIENKTGSPFNTQRSVHIPNLTYEEVEGMFKWYEKESGQDVEPEVIKNLHKETRGQPGLTCWMGELLTEGLENYPNNTTKPIRTADFDNIYQQAIEILPNNNILNIISKADTPPYRKTILSLFNTSRPYKFRFDKKEINFLYTNGVIEPEVIPGDTSYVRFASPFVQKRLFNYFSSEIFSDMGQLVESFYTVKEIIAPDHIDIRRLMVLYQTYLEKNKNWLFKDAPRRSDMRVYEAVFHFNLYAYLDELLRGKNVRIYPEFPTGNGKIDLLIRYKNTTYGIELKSFTDEAGYYDSLEQAAKYGCQLQLPMIYLVSYIESMDESHKKKYGKVFHCPNTNVEVHPIFIQTGCP